MLWAWVSRSCALGRVIWKCTRWAMTKWSLCMVGYAELKETRSRRNSWQYVISDLTTRLGMNSKELIQEVCKKKHQNKTTDWMPRTKRKIRKSNNNFRSPQKAIINTRGERLKKENDKFSILLAESKNINVLDSGQNKTKTFFFF